MTFFHGMPRERKRLRILFLATAGAWVLLALNLVRIQYVEHERYAGMAAAQQENRRELAPSRGLLLDRNGSPLAVNIQNGSIVAEPKKIQNLARTVRAVSRRTQAPAKKVRSLLTSRRDEVILSRGILPVTDLRELESLPGLRSHLEAKRVYPLGRSACQVVGFVNIDQRGVEGAEREFDGWLRGSPGWVTLFKDAKGVSHSHPRGFRKPPVNGSDLVLTIDRYAQSVAEARLHAAVEEQEAKGGMVVIVDPRTGAIRAMASEPCFDPQDFTSVSAAAYRNRVLSDAWEPGSTFKLVTAGAALEAHSLAVDDILDCEHGAKDFGSFTLHDHERYGNLTFKNAFAVSSNIGLAKVGILTGTGPVYRMARDLGFGRPTGIRMPGEVGGTLRHPTRWSGRSLATISIGHEVTVTAMQLVMAFAAVANDGILLKPQLLDSVIDPEGNLAYHAEPEVVRRALSHETANLLKDFLGEVVRAGTGTKAAVPWCAVGGKTGTAQKYDPGTGTYSHQHYYSSFIGMAPLEDPVFVCLVVIDEPKGSIYGGSVAAPVFREILEAVATGPSPLVDPGYRRLVADPAAKLPPAATETDGAPRESEPRDGLLPGPAVAVSVRAPAAGSVAASAALAGDAAEPAPVLPDVRGLTAREALRVLSGLGVRSTFHGTGVVTSMSPEAGSPLEAGRTCTLELAPRAPRRGATDRMAVSRP